MLTETENPVDLGCESKEEVEALGMICDADTDTSGVFSIPKLNIGGERTGESKGAEKSL